MQNDWAYEELYRARLWDKRCLRTLIQACQQLAEAAQMSFSRTLGSRRKAVSRILHHKETSADDLLHGHVRATSLRAQAYPFILVASDTTNLDFTSHHATAGLGPIRTQPQMQGFFLHSALAITPQGIPLGMLHQQVWVRDQSQTAKSNPQTAKSNPQTAKSNRRCKRPLAQKESRKWGEALQGVQKALPSSQRALLLQDREADLFDFFCAPRREGLDLLIRATYPRRLLVSDPWGPATLKEAAQQAPLIGTRCVTVHARPNRAAREAQVCVRTTRVWVLPPKNSPTPKPPAVCLQLVYAYEPNPPPDVQEPLEWVLLTTLPVGDPSEAMTLLDDYTRRWLIERFHFVLKCGCGFEKLQLDQFTTLHKALSLYSIVAWRLLYCTHLAREAPQMPAEEVVCPTERQILELATGQSITTVKQALMAVAKIGGFVALPSDPNPGVMSLWIGFRKLHDMLAGFLLLRSASGSTYGTR